MKEFVSDMLSKTMAVRLRYFVPIITANQQKYIPT